MKTRINNTANHVKPILRIMLILQILVQTIALTACGGDGDGGNASNSGSNEKYDYCLLNGECLVGPFELSACSGQLSNSCPAGYETGSQTKPSSSSGSNTISGSGDYCIIEPKNIDSKGCYKHYDYVGDCSEQNNEYTTSRLSDSCPQGYICFDYSTMAMCDNTPSSSSVAPSSSSVLQSSSSATQNSSSSSVTPSSSSIGSSSSVQNSGTFTDSRDGNIYKWVRIGEQIWMAKNLNYAVTGSKCGNGLWLSDANTSTCAT